MACTIWLLRAGCVRSADSGVRRNLASHPDAQLNAVLKENLALRQMNQEAAQFEGGHRPLHHARSTPYLPAAVPSNFSSPYLSPHHDYRPGGRPISHSAPVGHLGFDDYPSHYDDHGRHGGGLPADLRHAGLGGPGHDHDLF